MRGRRAQAGLGGSLLAESCGPLVNSRSHMDAAPGASVAHCRRHLHRQRPPAARQTVDVPRFPQRLSPILRSGAQSRDQLSELAPAPGRGTVGCMCGVGS